jgi:hypothetical protein
MSGVSPSHTELDENGTKYSSYGHVLAQTMVEYKAPPVDNTTVAIKPVPPDYEQPEGTHSIGYLQSEPVDEYIEVGEGFTQPYYGGPGTFEERMSRYTVAPDPTTTAGQDQLTCTVEWTPPPTPKAPTMFDTARGPLTTEWKRPAKNKRLAPEQRNAIVVVRPEQKAASPYVPYTVKTWAHDPAKGNTSAMGYHRPISNTDAHPTGCAPVENNSTPPGYKWVPFGMNGETRLVKE